MELSHAAKATEWNCVTSLWFRHTMETRHMCFTSKRKLSMSTICQNGESILTLAAIHRWMISVESSWFGLSWVELAVPVFCDCRLLGILNSLSSGNELIINELRFRSLEQTADMRAMLVNAYDTDSTITTTTKTTASVILLYSAIRIHDKHSKYEIR